LERCLEDWRATISMASGFWVRPFNADKPEQPSMREQIELTREIWIRGVPVFGLCRGLQLMTAALGGTVRFNQLRSTAGMRDGARLERDKPVYGRRTSGAVP
jgi:gamma-glutamyl-gamma-aminobutyrate hydrolase PuuD